MSERPVEHRLACAYTPAMNWRSLPAPLLCGAILISLVTVASAVPRPPQSAKPSNQAALLQRAAAAARQHQLLAIHARTSQQQLLLQQARRPERLAAIGGSRRDDRSRSAPVTKIQND